MKFLKTCLQVIYILLGSAAMVVAPFAFFFYLLEFSTLRSIIYAWLVCAFLIALVIFPTGTTKARKDRKRKRTMLKLKKVFCAVFCAIKKFVKKIYDEIFSEEYIED